MFQAHHDPFGTLTAYIHLLIALHAAVLIGVVALLVQTVRLRFKLRKKV